MKKVRVTATRSRIFGSASRTVEEGEVLDLEDDVALDLVNSGNAEMVEEKPAPAAVAEAPATEAAIEQASRRRPPARG